MSRMAAKLAFIPQALSEGKMKRGEMDLPLTIIVVALSACACQRERERDVFLTRYAWY